MEWTMILAQIFEICVIPLLGLLTKYAINFLRVKSQQIIDASDNDLKDKYVMMATNTISACVMATNQTYVDALKKENAFTPEAQKEAFTRTYDAVLALLTDEAKIYLAEAYGDLNMYITQMIESNVHASKTL